MWQVGSKEACGNINLSFQKITCWTKSSWSRMQGILTLLIFWKVLVVLAAHCREALVDNFYSPSTALSVLMGGIYVLDHLVWVLGRLHWMCLTSPWSLPATQFLDLQFLKSRYNTKFLSFILTLSNNNYFCRWRLHHLSQNRPLLKLWKTQDMHHISQSQE